MPPDPVAPSMAEIRALLLGEGAVAQPEVALAQLRRQSDEGDADSANLLATLTANGAWTPQDWPTAFAYLDRAVRLGSRSAQGQLEVLAPGGGGAISLDAWLTPPERRNLCEAPRVRTIDGFVSPAVCDWLIGLAKGRVRPAMMVEGYGAAPALSSQRTNSDFAFTVFDGDCVLALVRQRISAVLKLPVAAMEPPQVFHYAVGQELKPHVDYLQRKDRDRSGYQGDRIATFLIYLNDNFEGGETYFPRVDLKAKAPRGGALYFANVDGAGRPDPMTLHAGLAPSAGEKWLFSQWSHDRPFGR